MSVNNGIGNKYNNNMCNNIAAKCKLSTIYEYLPKTISHASVVLIRSNSSLKQNISEYHCFSPILKLMCMTNANL